MNPSNKTLKQKLQQIWESVISQEIRLEGLFRVFLAETYSRTKDEKLGISSFQKTVIDVISEVIQQNSCNSIKHRR